MSLFKAQYLVIKMEGKGTKNHIPVGYIFCFLQFQNGRSYLTFSEVPQTV